MISSHESWPTSATNSRSSVWSKENRQGFLSPYAQTSSAPAVDPMNGFPGGNCVVDVGVAGEVVGIDIDS